MRCKKLDNYRIIKGAIIVLIVSIPGFLLAQNDTISQNFESRFKSNISALNNLYCWNDSSYLQGELILNEEVDFTTELKKNAVFTELDVGAEKFYAYLQRLRLVEKQHLINYFLSYETVFENELKAHSLPEELKYLAPTISAMNPLAIGENKEVGIWQLKHFQGNLNGLQIDRLVDERFNEQLSTKAAVKQLKQNLTIFGSVEYAVIAYLVGNTKLQNTLARCGANSSISEIIRQLPVSVTEMLAAYQAMTIFLRTNTFESEMEFMSPDIASVNRQVHFQQISQVLSIPEKQLQFLNPQFKYSIVPGDRETMSLALPKGKQDDFFLWLDSIYNSYDSTLFQVVAQNIEYPPAPNRQYVGEKVKDLEIEGKTKIQYTIKSGDLLGFIAEDYNVRVADLKYWNNIYNERRIQVGQKLNIFVDDENAEYYTGLQNENKKKKEKPTDMVAKLTDNSPVPLYKVPDSARKVEHIVKSGESPYVIAKKYDGVTPEQILEWNGIKDARKIQIGQKLIIYME